MDYIFRAEQIEVPQDLPGIMKAWTKEVIRYAPTDVTAFSKEYFAAMAKGAEALGTFLTKHEELSTQPKIEKEKRESIAGPAAINIKVQNNIDGGEAVAITSSEVDVKDEHKKGSLKITSSAPILAKTPKSNAGGVRPEIADRKRAIYKAAFDKFDDDNSGTMDTAELETLLKELGWDHSVEALEQASDVLDKDKDGSIDLEEFMKWTEYAWKSQALNQGANASGGSLTEPKARRRSRRGSTLAIVGE
jgi:hypothetical protein